MFAQTDLRISRYPPHTEMAPHQHDEASMNIVVSGNFLERVSLIMAQIAREAGRHEIHLAREFRRFFGIPVAAYLRRLRIEQAERLLLKPQIPIGEIAQSCGFASHSHLCREFRSHFGVAPSEYRSRSR